MADDGVRSERPFLVFADAGVERGGVASDCGAGEGVIGEGSTEEAVQKQDDESITRRDAFS